MDQHTIISLRPLILNTTSDGGGCLIRHGGALDETDLFHVHGDQVQG